MLEATVGNHMSGSRTLGVIRITPMCGQSKQASCWLLHSALVSIVHVSIMDVSTRDLQHQCSENTTLHHNHHQAHSSTDTPDKFGEHIYQYTFYH
jgi:hypothetical protein